MTEDVERIVRVLLEPPADLQRASDAERGIPREPGFYAWWAATGAIKGVPPNPNPMVEGLDLFYVGISPRNARSTRNLRARVVDNHLNGNTGSSTFRLTLASLLLETLKLTPLRRGKKVILPPDQNTKLSRWQRDHLRLTWCVQPEPWLYEEGVIRTLAPPLNIATNAQHPFYVTLRAARAGFRAAAVAPEPAALTEAEPASAGHDDVVEEL
jgi:hypothetical protein